jgi:lipopolysaccharide transport system ATP-binding protein
MSDIAIRAEGLSKSYLLGEPESYVMLRDSLAKAIARPFRRGRETPEKRETFWALDDLSFEIKQGEVIGVIGRNGAGKSTLLKVLSRITWPTKGRATIHGRVGSLLEVGTGFHQELTGRENIYLNGAILGMRKAEIDAKFDEIVAFSEMEKFLDTAVKHYSSGMYVRLGFAIAAHLEPEILIVDEVLAVGDLNFQKKCIGKMNEVSRDGRTVLFVSHNMAAVENLCQRGLVMHQGRLAYQGDLKDAVHYYLKTVCVGSDPEGHIIDLSQAANRKSNVGKLLQRIELFTDGDVPAVEGIRLGSSLRMRIHLDVPDGGKSLDLGLGFDDLFGQRIFTAHSLFEPERPAEVSPGPHVFVCEIPSFTLFPGTYNLRIWMHINSREADAIADAVKITVIGTDYYGTGKPPWNGKFVLPQRWYLEPKTPSNFDAELSCERI